MRQLVPKAPQLVAAGSRAKSYAIVIGLLVLGLAGHGFPQQATPSEPAAPKKDQAVTITKPTIMPDGQVPEEKRSFNPAEAPQKPEVSLPMIKQEPPPMEGAGKQRLSWIDTVPPLVLRVSGCLAYRCLGVTHVSDGRTRKTVSPGGTTFLPFMHGEEKLMTTNGRAHLSLGAFGVARLDPESEVRLPASADTSHSIELVKGNMIVRLFPEELQKRSQAVLLIKTPLAVLAATSPSFQITLTKEGHLLHVYEGQVEVRHATRGQMLVKKGNEILISPSEVTVPRMLPSSIWQNPPQIEDMPVIVAAQAWIRESDGKHQISANNKLLSRTRMENPARPYSRVDNSDPADLAASFPSPGIIRFASRPGQLGKKVTLELFPIDKARAEGSTLLISFRLRGKNISRIAYSASWPETGFGAGRIEGEIELPAGGAWRDVTMPIPGVQTFIGMPREPLALEISLPNPPANQSPPLFDLGDLTVTYLKP